MLERGSGATAKYFASSSAVMTRSRCCSPGNNLIFGAAAMTPHSTASRRIRLRARRDVLTVLTDRERVGTGFFLRSPLVTWEAWARVISFRAKSAACSPVIASRRSLASGSYEQRLLMRELYQCKLAGHVFSNCALAQGSIRSLQNSTSVTVCDSQGLRRM